MVRHCPRDWRMHARLTCLSGQDRFDSFINVLFESSFNGSPGLFQPFPSAGVRV